MSHKIDKEIAELADTLQKAGERGAVISGYSPSGKPVYQSNVQAQEQWRERHKKPSKGGKPPIAKADEKVEGSEDEEKKEEVKKAEEELAVKDTIKGIVEKARELGPEGLKKASANLTEEGKAILSKILAKAKAISMDKEALKKPKNQKDLDSHEVPKQEGGMDEEDEKLMKPEAQEQKHQGDNSPEGFEGQIIKAEDKPKIQGAVNEYEKNPKDPKNEFKKPSEKAKPKEEESEKEEVKPSKKNEDKKMKKSDKFEEIYKSDDKMIAMCKRMIEKGMKKNEYLDKANNMGWELDKCNDMWSRAESSNKKMKKAIVWNDLQADLFGSTYKRGRNHISKGNDDAIEAEHKKTTEALKKGEYLNEFTHEVFQKAEGTKKVTVNDLIEKGLDSDSTHVEAAYRNLEHKKIPNPTLVKSFEDSEIDKLLGLDKEKADAILGKK